MLQLYGYWRSSAAYRVRIALNLKGIPYEQVSVHLVKDGGEQHKPEYRSLNPQGLVPFLIDGDTKLSQSIAMLEYLEERHPEPRLLPEDIHLKAKVRATCQTIACDIHPVDNLRVLKYLTGKLGVEEEQKMEWYRHWITLGFTALEQQLQEYSKQGPYCFGEQLTMADACLIPQVYNANRFACSMESFPRLRAINDACLGLEAFKQAIPEAQPDAT